MNAKAAGSRSGMDKTRIAGFPVVTAGRAALTDRMAIECRREPGEPGLGAVLVFDINGHGISLAATDPAYREAMREADIIHADGGVWVVLSRLTGHRIAERSATTDLMTDFAERCEQDGRSFFLLGGSEEVNVAFTAFLAARYPRLRIAGRRNGYFTPEQDAAVIEEIAAAQPDVIWVGMGKPREQQFSIALKRRLDHGWIVTCGGCYNYFVGEYTRAPKWMQWANLEWLHRMMTQPRKFAWRYITTNPHSLALGIWDVVKLAMKRSDKAR
ncbi:MULTISPECIES: WecB/TagA/CpsF family glycosyltransferase [unclassified Sphingomonas]|uniref:WecB/TagA/CpsF family glycosyltransferase n=1 Tax=unclassified Sphingomonas TaxID=196159 RepID=UPI000A9C0963|nr:MULTISPECIES: WecB/TagA/CpsF family glycosyltransferase [unclassified Sphingomonas]